MYIWLNAGPTRTNVMVPRKPFGSVCSTGFPPLLIGVTFSLTSTERRSNCVSNPIMSSENTSPYWSMMAKLISVPTLYPCTVAFTAISLAPASGHYLVDIFRVLPALAHPLGGGCANLLGPSLTDCLRTLGFLRLGLFSTDP